MPSASCNLQLCWRCFSHNFPGNPRVDDPSAAFIGQKILWCGNCSGDACRHQESAWDGVKTLSRMEGRKNFVQCLCATRLPGKLLGSPGCWNGGLSKEVGVVGSCFFLDTIYGCTSSSVWTIPTGRFVLRGWFLNYFWDIFPASSGTFSCLMNIFQTGFKTPSLVLKHLACKKLFPSPDSWFPKGYLEKWVSAMQELEPGNVKWFYPKW